MKVRYYPDTDTAELEFNENPVAETREVNENLYLDLDADGNLVSLTIEHAKESACLKELSYIEVDDRAS